VIIWRKRRLTVARFTVVEDSEGNYSLLNIDRIGMISEIRDGHCRIIFSPTFTVEMNGEGADLLVGSLLGDSELVNGTSTAEAIEKFKRSKDSLKPKVIPFDGSESQT
jgi:hypothetical protein